VNGEVTFETRIDQMACYQVGCGCQGFQQPQVEMVNHPAHYNSGKIEVWDFIIDQDLTYCLGDAVKYITRCGKKDPDKQIQDLEKAKAYIDREIKRIRESGGEDIRTANLKAFNEFGKL
jgi:hypothetical protein